MQGRGRRRARKVEALDEQPRDTVAQQPAACDHLRGPGVGCQAPQAPALAVGRASGLGRLRHGGRRQVPGRSSSSAGLLCSSTVLPFTLLHQPADVGRVKLVQEHLMDNLVREVRKRLSADSCDLHQPLRRDAERVRQSLDYCLPAAQALAAGPPGQRMLQLDVVVLAGAVQQSGRAHDDNGLRARPGGAREAGHGAAPVLRVDEEREGGVTSR
mmetsp:Transcript_88062/g.272797  ORF Transcript_88062/g.272797 Transcript_88062/m.272797 type:complete len:214 (-) Transcript_88062:629-1270(-)